MLHLVSISICLYHSLISNARKFTALGFIQAFWSLSISVAINNRRQIFSGCLRQYYSKCHLLISTHLFYSTQLFGAFLLTLKLWEISPDILMEHWYSHIFLSLNAWGDQNSILILLNFKPTHSSMNNERSFWTSVLSLFYFRETSWFFFSFFLCSRNYRACEISACSSQTFSNWVHA